MLCQAELMQCNRNYKKGINECLNLSTIQVTVQTPFYFHILAAKLPPRKVSNHKLRFSHKGKSPEALKSSGMLLMIFLFYIKGICAAKKGRCRTL